MTELSFRQTNPFIERGTLKGMYDAPKMHRSGASPEEGLVNIGAKANSYGYIGGRIVDLTY